MPVVDACIAGFGATDGLPTKQTFVLQQDGKISQVSGSLLGAEWSRYLNQWAFLGNRWMQRHYAEEVAKVESAADRREAGALQAKLCKEYAASLE